MRISDTEIKKILARPAGEEAVQESTVSALVEVIDHLGVAADRKVDDELVQQITEQVLAMPDREDLINDLRNRIESGTYRPSGEDIVDAMIRRNIADRVR